MYVDLENLVQSVEVVENNSFPGYDSFSLSSFLNNTRPALLSSVSYTSILLCSIVTSNVPHPPSPLTHLVVRTMCVIMRSK